MDTFPLDDQSVSALQRTLTGSSSYGDLLETLDKIDFRTHTFFSSLVFLTPFQVKRILTPFYHAVVEWSAVLKHLQSRVSDTNPKAAKIIQENLDDESGDENNPAHTVTYRLFLHSLSAQLVLSRESQAVTEFNQRLLEYVVRCDPSLCAAVLAGIERSYVKVSGLIREFCQKHRIEQRHYSEHEILDMTHADQLVEAAFDLQCDNSDLIEGMVVGYQLIWRVYEKLYQEFFRVY